MSFSWLSWVPNHLIPSSFSGGWEELSVKWKYRTKKLIEKEVVVGQSSFLPLMVEVKLLPFWSYDCQIYLSKEEWREETTHPNVEDSIKDSLIEKEYTYSVQSTSSVKKGTSTWCTGSDGTSIPTSTLTQDRLLYTCTLYTVKVRWGDRRLPSTYGSYWSLRSLGLFPNPRDLLIR